MSTHAFIGFINKDNTVKAVYCQHDGYPQGVGMVLKEYYPNAKKINELLDFGYLDALRSNVENSTFCIRDCDEEERTNKTKTFENLECFFKFAISCGCAYVYYFIDGNWQYRTADWTNRKYIDPFKLKENTAKIITPNVLQQMIESSTNNCMNDLYSELSKSGLGESDLNKNGIIQEFINAFYKMQ